jgi:hypothetical protein
LISSTRLKSWCFGKNGEPKASNLCQEKSMGVDFFPCDRCGESICDCGDYERCGEDCCRRWCSRECANLDGYRDDEEAGCYTCNFCRNEDVEDVVLLKFLLKHFKISEKKAKKLYFKKLKERMEKRGKKEDKQAT